MSHSVETIWECDKCGQKLAVPHTSYPLNWEKVCILINNDGNQRWFHVCSTCIGFDWQPARVKSIFQWLFDKFRKEGT